MNQLISDTLKHWKRNENYLIKCVIAEEEKNLQEVKYMQRIIIYF